MNNIKQNKNKIASINHREILFKNDKKGELKMKVVKGDFLTTDETLIFQNMYEVCEPKPEFITMVGELSKEDNIAVAVVGSRKISDYGRQVCEFIVKELAAAGVTIVSGLMYGVDLCAHKAAISAGGRTIAVLGYGFDHLLSINYSHTVIEDILENNCGAIISEYPYYQAPDTWTFPRRNRIVSALSRAIVIIEASEKSGSIITAGLALEQGKEVFVVPGSIFSKVSKGKHQLIKQGANLIDCADDILNFLNLSKKLNDIEKLNMRKNLKDEEAKIYSEISEAATGISLDNLVFKTRNPPSEISVIITSLELKGLIKRGLAGEFLLLK